MVRVAFLFLCLAFLEGKHERIMKYTVISDSFHSAM